MLLEHDASLSRRSYYEASVNRPMPHAALQDQVQADVCVVGAGHTGLSAALSLAQRGFSVCLLEAQRVGGGASGRNGGQIIVGCQGQEALERQLSPAQARQAWDISVEGVDLMKRRITQHGIECEHVNGYMQVAVNARKAAALHEWALHVQQRYRHELVWIGPQDVGRWVSSPRYHAAVWDGVSGHVHPLKYCLGLAQAVQQAGVRMHEHTPVSHIDRGPVCQVHTLSGGCVACQFVVLAGNVYLSEYGQAIAPEVTHRILPIATYMVATEPMEADRAHGLIRQRAAVSDTNMVLDYFRVTEDRRLLFGTGDNFDLRHPGRLVEKVRRQMLRVFPQLADLSITHGWGGYVDMTLNQAPDFGRLGANVYYLQGFSGHGMALSGMAGLLVAEAIDGQADRFDVFARVRHIGFPRATWVRHPALMVGNWLMRLRDLL